MGRKKQPERKPAVKDAHKRFTAEKYLRGWTQQQIADALEISQPTVSNDLAELRAEWQAEAGTDIDAKIARELARIDALEMEYWRQYEASLEDKTVTTAKQRGKVEKNQNVPTTSETSKRIEKRNGDPRYLAGVQWCIERRCKLMGIDKPVKVDHTSGGESFTTGLASVFQALSQLEKQSQNGHSIEHVPN